MLYLIGKNVLLKPLQEPCKTTGFWRDFPREFELPLESGVSHETLSSTCQRVLLFKIIELYSSFIRLLSHLNRFLMQFLSILFSRLSTRQKEIKRDSSRVDEEKVKLRVAFERFVNLKSL